MAGEWKQVAFADVIELISGGTPKTSVSEYWGGSIPWLSVKDFNTGYRWANTAEKTITERGLAESATTILNRGDIIISARGTVGVVAQLAQPMAFNQSCYGIRGRQGIAETNFVYYALRHAVSQMQQVAHGGVFNTITRDTFKIIKTKLPPLKEQRAIACILGALDDKIELNRRMNETLEAMARAIFKSWFVNFDPVRAKAEGQQPPGLAPHIADLFPDAFEDSKLGQIPKGWKVGTLGGVCEKAQYGYTATATDDPIGPRFLRIKDINKQDWIEWQNVPYCRIKKDKIDKYRLAKGDVVIARMADPGHGALIEDDIGAVFASYLIRFRPIRPEFGRFLQYWLRSETYWNLVISRQSGTTRANLNAQVLSSFPLVVANDKVLKAFSSQVDALRSKLVGNVNESRILASIRDTLLPKLISGELRVPDAERIVGRCV